MRGVLRIFVKIRQFTSIEAVYASFVWIFSKCFDKNNSTKSKAMMYSAVCMMLGDGDAWNDWMYLRNKIMDVILMKVYITLRMVISVILAMCVRSNVFNSECRFDLYFFVKYVAYTCLIYVEHDLILHMKPKSSSLICVRCDSFIMLYAHVNKRLDRKVCVWKASLFLNDNSFCCSLIVFDMSCSFGENNNEVIVSTLQI